MSLIYTWLFDKNDNKITPYILLDSIMLDEEGSTFTSKYNTDLAKKVNNSDVASVATSGKYDDISNKPTVNGVELVGALTSAALKLADQQHTHTASEINGMPTALSQLTNDSNFITLSALTNYVLKTSLAAVATSGDYTDLKNKPDIPTKISELNNDSNFITNSTLSDYLKKNDVKAIATSGSYNDLIDTPTYATIASTGNYSDLNNKPTFAAVATSGSYNDLTDTPIPGTDISKISQLDNDVGFITSSALSGYATTSSLATVATSGSYNDLSDIPTFPTKTSDLTNDNNFITNDALNGYTKDADLSAVAKGGSYNNLTDTPTFADVATSGNYNDLSNTPSLAAVATSGSYNDLNNLPVVFNATSVTNLCNTLGPILGGTLTGVWDEATSAYIFTFTPSETA